MLFVDVHAFAYVVDDSHICLMRYDPVDILDAFPCLFQYILNGLLHGFHRKAKGRISFHADHGGLIGLF